MQKENNQFQKLLEQLSKQNNRAIPQRLLSIDPGETTGYAIFRDGELYETEQLTVKKDGLQLLHHAFREHYFDYVVIEDYRIYPNKLRQHVLNDVFTVKVIGAIEFMFAIRETNRPLRITYQMASLPQGFVTKEKIKQWEMWTVAKIHARSAVVHGAYYLLFGRR